MLKFALYAVLAYLLLRAVANLLRAMRQPGRVGPEGRSPRFGREEGRGQQRSHQPRSQDRATRLSEEEEVEDARWEDL